ncbi:DnaJ-like subfamily A member 2 [Symbiodinium microadriaticum]|uniref:DnaJ-like subfamily A member 2 n=1 Tax=Symbiodinium microadriaticum TaxID=2951 RepID=A0A1Q9F2Y1_SYMMI|nr:DnaJ-like subfamily A member 2 [Symbiodinium microadriaticum]
MSGVTRAQEALLGFDRSVRHLDGRTIHFSYSQVTKPSAILRIRGEGFPHRGDPTERGDLYVKCNLIMPEDGEQWLQDMLQRSAEVK